MDLQVAAYFSPRSDLDLKILIEPEDSGWSVGAGISTLTIPYRSLPLLRMDGSLSNGLEMILIKRIQPAQQSI